LGDCASIIDPNTSKPYPLTAQAIRELLQRREVLDHVKQMRQVKWQILAALAGAHNVLRVTPKLVNLLVVAEDINSR